MTRTERDLQANTVAPGQRLSSRAIQPQLPSTIARSLFGETVTGPISMTSVLLPHSVQLGQSNANVGLTYETP